MVLTDFRGVFFPYCLQKQEDGTYAILNRHYKPLGFQTSKWLTYSDYPVCAKIKITQAMAVKLSIDKKKDLDRIYLYSDGSKPTRGKKFMTAYLQKLALLAKLKVSYD